MKFRNPSHCTVNGREKVIQYAYNYMCTICLFFIFILIVGDIQITLISNGNEKEAYNNRF